ncbi:response regulator [Roseiconus lacunae]|uniref:Response regulator n=1 Tax=Roseiconus lacunae TaxID=2605694 RepID=A0ABT7PCY7_9BACT|nr:response regulator [Roseiconus lacunae]MCD0459666.1 response regulator [Roseiconus lacunae]MDM4014364.1 response regulator [Roseiconus lacunae]
MAIPIVVVDDSEHDRYLAKRVIEMLDYDIDVVEFRAGDHFLEKFTDAKSREIEIGTTPPPILVLLDINMPRLDGFDVLSAIKDHFGAESNREVIVSMYTSSSFEDDVERAHGYDFVKDYVIKPLSKSDAQRLVDKHCLNISG